MPWSRARDALGDGALGPEVACSLGTVRADGRPYSAGVGIAECGDELYFTSGAGTRKSRNLSARPACTLSLRLNGIDLVLEGDARRVTDRPTLDAVAAVYRAGGWPARAEADAITAPYSAQSAGPPPWNLYRLDVRAAVGVALRAPHGASRWRF